MYKLHGYLDLAPGRPALLIPVFTKKGINTPFVQSMDEFFQIEDFSPYYYCDEFDYVNELRVLEADIGQGGVLAFRFPGGEIFFGGIDQLFEAVESQPDHFLAGAPLLKMQLERITVADLPEQYGNWQLVANTFFETQGQRDLWLDGELQLYQNNDKIWKRINAKNKPEPAKRLTIDPSELDTEELITVLSDPKYYEFVGWEELWLQLKSRLPRDERVCLIANDWLYHTLVGALSDIGRTRKVFVEVLAYWRTTADPDQRFIEFLSEIIGDGSFFSDELRIPFSSLVAALQVIGRNKKSDGYISALLRALETNYFSYTQTEKLLSDLEELIASPKDIAEIAGNYADVLRGVRAKLSIFEGEELVQNFDATWATAIGRDL